MRSLNLQFLTPSRGHFGWSWKNLSSELNLLEQTSRHELNSAHEVQSAESNIDELNEEIKSFGSDISAVTDAKSMLESDLEEARSKVAESE